MCKYEEYRQELIQELVTKQIDGFELINMVIELCEKIDMLDEKLNREE